MSACLPEYLRFQRAAKQVAREQVAVLEAIVSANAETEFGRRHGFRSIRSAREFQIQVPLRNYDDHQNWITRIAAGEERVLTCEQVRLFEPTSGSTGASKLIPYTASLQQQFRCGIQTWIADLFLSHPQLVTGKAYWSVSPVATQTRRTQGGIPIGFEDDTAYLGGWQQRLANAIMAVPNVVSRAGEIDAVRYLTLLFLVRCRNLKLISVWNPTFLTLLIEHLPAWGEQIAHDLEKGGISWESADHRFLANGHKDLRRAQELREALRCNSAAERHARLWPGLRLISCWTDANAAAPAALLQTLFPQSQIQGKGLLATEGLVSFPLAGHDAPALSVRSHFFEFLPVLGGGKVASPRLAHELIQGERYSVAITTGGGLYRYQMGDLVEVTGYFHECPLIHFLGRHNHISDWFGEKLNEAHVARVLKEAFAHHEITPPFAMLACDTRPAPAYVLYIETESLDSVLEQVGQDVEKALCGNFHYQYARQLGQLAPIKIFRVEHAAASYLDTAMAAGQRAGDVKPVALDQRDIWWKVFQGRFISCPSRHHPFLRRTHVVIQR